MTWEFQRAWWETCAWGKPLFVVAEREGEIVAIAPFIADRRSVSLVGDQEADWQDFVGDLSDDATVCAILEAICVAAPASAVFDLRNLPAGRVRQLDAAAAALGLEGTYSVLQATTPLLEVAARPAKVAAMVAHKASREDRWFRKNGQLEVEFFQDGEAILPHLDAFIQQNIERWSDASAGYSPFSEPTVQEFVHRLTRLMSTTGWLRFGRLLWNGRPIAYDYNFSYAGRFSMWRASWAIDLAARSPGAVMTRHVLQSAIDEGVALVDWGPGRTPYKFETATHTEEMSWWGTSR